LKAVIEERLKWFSNRGVGEFDWIRTWNTRISIVIQITGDFGSILSTALNGAVFALLDAGISLKFIPIATSVCLTDKRQLLLDPTSDQENNSVVSSFFVFNKTSQGLISSKSNGVFSDEEFMILLKAAKSTIPSIYEFIQKSIVQLRK
jgi:ribonuclease PH